MRGPREDPSVAGSDEGAARCPYCDGTNTQRDHRRGPSSCRSLQYCRDCQESFEALR
jgi:hypothetical protein